MSDGPERLDQLRRKYAGDLDGLIHAVARKNHKGDIAGLPTRVIDRLLREAEKEIQK